MAWSMCNSVYYYVILCGDHFKRIVWKTLAGFLQHFRIKKLARLKPNAILTIFPIGLHGLHLNNHKAEKQ